VKQGRRQQALDKFAKRSAAIVGSGPAQKRAIRGIKHELLREYLEVSSATLPHNHFTKSSRSPQPLYEIIDAAIRLPPGSVACSTRAPRARAPGPVRLPAGPPRLLDVLGGGPASGAEGLARLGRSCSTTSRCRA
jgi:hypothetical protein